jgi:aspartyl-tRNA(Asn)/glutamyl-tRNA(Gln) amidotransferase subunit A
VDVSHVAEPAWLDAQALRVAYASGELSPVEVHDAVVARIEELEPTVNAFWVRDSGASRAAAHASEQRWFEGAPLGALDGIPLTLKENIARAGVPMPSGTAALEPVAPTADAPVTARVNEAGAIVLGSTVMPDWGMLSSGVSSLHGLTRSPLNPQWTTGGSSSGAGAAAAAGFGPLHVGTDIGGSIRLPGTWLGLVTLKPSAGRVPLSAPYLGRVAGPLTRSARDAAVLMSVIAQPDDRDWSALPPMSLDWSAVDRVCLDDGVRGLRVGVHVDAGCGLPVDPAVQDIVDQAARVFEDGGAIVEPLAPFMRPEWLAALDLFWRVRSWNDLLALPEDARARALPFVVRWAEGGASASGVDVLRAYQATQSIRAATVAATQPYDVVLSPVAPMAAFPAEWPMPWGPDEDLGMAHIGFTAPYNMSGQPAGTVNAGFLHDGRPVGVQVSGRRWDDVGVLCAIAWFEGVTGGNATL